MLAQVLGGWGSTFPSIAKMSLTGDHCRWCARPFDTTPHPLTHKRIVHALLPRRAPRSRECTICFLYIAEAYPYESSSSKAKKELEVKFSDSQTERDKYNAALSVHEEELNARGGHLGPAPCIRKYSTSQSRDAREQFTKVWQAFVCHRTLGQVVCLTVAFRFFRRRKRRQ